MARIYANENFPHLAVQGLRSLGHDVVSTHDAGQHNRLDFLRLHTLTPDHAGIVVCKVERDNVALADRVHAGLIAAGSSLDGPVARVNRPG